MQALEELQAKVKARANLAQALFEALRGARDTTSTGFTCE